MLKQCEKCGKFFGAKVEEDVLCSECAVPEALEHIIGMNLEEKKYELARSIVYDQPDISPEELIKQMRDQKIEITVKEIMSYVREGKMILKGAENGIFCEDCGKKILSGRRCPKCTKAIEKKITANKKVEPEQEAITTTKKSSRMFTAD